MLRVRFLEHVTRPPAGKKDAEPDGGRVDRPATKRLERLDDCLAEVGADVTLEPQRFPLDRKDSGRDRSAGDARDTVQPGEDAELVETAECAAVKQGRAEPSSREGETDAGLHTFAAERHFVPPPGTVLLRNRPLREQPECHGSGGREIHCHAGLGEGRGTQACTV
jgi:hypothetical protein